MNLTRSYDMRTRGVAAAQTAERIVSTTIELLQTSPIVELTLNDVAAGAGVSVQTVLRRFGDRESLFAAAVEHFAREVFTQRGQAIPDDIDAIVTNLLDHYEQWGSLVVKIISEQGASPAIAATVRGGAAYHRDWCAAVFPAALAGLSRTERTRRLAQLVTICDVRVWHQLRTQNALSRAQTHTALVEMLAPLAIQES